MFVNITPAITDAEVVADNHYVSGCTMPAVTLDGSFEFNAQSVTA